MPFVLAVCVAAGLGGGAWAQPGDAAGFEVEVVAKGLVVPWSMDFAPDGRIFVTERGGGIRVVSLGDDGMWGMSEPVRMIGEGGVVEGGLLGIAVDPGFGDNGFVYVYHTYAGLFGVYNKVVRLAEGDDGMLGGDTVLVDGIPGGPIHDGGRIGFGPDGMLYVTTGDAANPGLAQDAGSLGGKVLRIDVDGGVPGDNTWEVEVFSMGHRNPQGMDWDPVTGVLVVSEHGPSGERGFGHDEINVVVEGGNYGWPRTVGDEEADGMVGPVLHSGTATWAPGGAAFYDSDAIPEFEGRLLVATLAGRDLMAIGIDVGNMTVTGEVERYLSGEYGRLRDVEVGGDGSVFVMTSNRDGRGSPAEDDDRIIRIVPVSGVGGGEDGGGEDGGGEDGDEVVRRADDGGVTVYETPRRQMEMVSDIHDVRCNDGLVLVFKKVGWSPACVSPGTAEELVQRGWAADHDADHHGGGGGQ